MKKFISIMLAVVLILSVGTASVGTAFAADAPAAGQSARDVLGEFITESEAVLADSSLTLPVKERTNLEDALKEAKKVYGNENATDQQLMDAAQDLLAAAESPIVRNAVAQAKRIYINMLDLVSFVLSAEETAAMNQIIALMDEALAKDTLTIGDFQTLETQINQITESVEPTAITKEHLGILIEKTTPYKEHPERYTAGSFAPFAAAYQDAVNTYAASSPSQDDLDIVFSTLAAMAAGLTENPELPKLDKYGDLNGDGKITVADALILQKSLAKVLALDTDQQKYGDVDANGKIAVNDVLLIQQYIALAIDRFPAEKPADIEDTPVDDVPFAE